MSEDGPVNLTELEKARKWGKVADYVGMSFILAIILGAAGCAFWFLIWALSANLLIGLIIIGAVALISLIIWAGITSSRAEKLESQARQFGVVDE